VAIERATRGAAQHFFFYGTLQHGRDNPLSCAVHRHLQKLGPAQCRGRLLAIRDRHGWYPALIAAPGRVSGTLYRAAAPLPAGLLRRLDRYEGDDYRRTGMTVHAAGCGAVRAIVYRYARSRPAGAHAIVRGDFADWLGGTGRQAYRPTGATTEPNSL